MKQLIIAFTTLLAAAMLVSCEHNYSVKGYKNLPPEAKSTIENHFPGIDVIRVETDRDDGKITYDVTLSNGIEIEFDSDGRWTDIDGNRATSLPDGLIPTQILEYVNQNFAGAKITGIDRRYRGYEVELDNGVELKFDENFNFVSDYNPAKAISPDEMPGDARSIIETYFPDEHIKHVERDYDDGIIVYELKFTGGIEIKFDENGNWIEIECKYTPVPDGLIPPQILDYVNSNYSRAFISGIEKKGNGTYEIELSNGVDLLFDKDFNLIGTDNGDYDDDRRIPFEELPSKAQETLSAHFNVDEIISIEKETDDWEITYEVELRKDISITFDADGQWIEIDCNRTNPVPASLVPEKIMAYVTDNHSGNDVTKIELTDRGYYEVELSNGLELIFDRDFNFIRIDR